MAGARIHGGSSLRALVQNQKRQRIASSSSTSSTSSSSEPLGALILSGSSPSFLGTRSMVSFEDMNGGNMSESSFLRAFDPDDRGDDELDEYFRQPEKKRRLTTDQVEFLEKSFEVENKLEPDRKVQLAKDVGLQPRQVAIWFQNRRARWKTKQLEKDYHTLQSSYSSLKADYDNLQEDKEKLKAEVLHLASKLLLKKKERGIITNPGMTSTQKPNDEGSRVSNAVGSKQQQDLSSAKSDAFESDSPPRIDGGGQSASLFEPEPDNAVFEPDQSDLSQEEEGDLSKSLLPPMIFPKIEDAEYPYPSTSSCNYGFPVEDHNAFWSWSY